MLRLKLATEKRWAELAEKNLKEAMIDHAFCEQKAASSAISIIVNFPDYPELVKKMSEIAIEEMEHFRAVHDKILARGWKLKLGRKNDYVNKISKFFPKTSDRKLNLINKLLLAAMIEARSCERFRVLTLTIKDKELVEFYHELTKSEAGRNASAIIYFIAIVLFVLEEYFVEPVINVFGESVHTFGGVVVEGSDLAHGGVEARAGFQQRRAEVRMVDDLKFLIERAEVFDLILDAE